MAFSAITGIYTNPLGAENAQPGQVIRSATWNTINISYAAALTQLAQWRQSSSVVTKSANYTIATTDYGIILNGAGVVTLTMPTPSSFIGRWIHLKTVATFAVVASATVVAPLNSTVAGTTIVSNTAGKWAELTSDGTNWVIMAGN